MDEENKIKVGFCVAYDWYLLRYSLPLIYKEADEICLSIDKDRISWSGNSFSWDEQGFRTLIGGLDKQNKVKVLEEDYHLKDLKPMENEVRQRNKIGEFLGKGGWHIQLDTDEFFLNFKGFVEYLKDLKPKRKINVLCPWITLYKQDTDGFYYIKPERFSQIEFMQIATQWPYYEYGRRNGYFNIYTQFAILHLSWARSQQEIEEKIGNWGHKDDFDAKLILRQWKELNRENFKTYKNVHHLKPEIWPAIEFVEARGIDSLIENKSLLQLPGSKRDYIQQNSIWLSRLKSLFSKLKGEKNF